MKKLAIAILILIASLFILPWPRQAVLDMTGFGQPATVDSEQLEQFLATNPAINATTLLGKDGLHYLNAANLIGTLSPGHFSAYEDLITEGRIPTGSKIQTDQSPPSSSPDPSSFKANSSPTLTLTIANGHLSGSVTQSGLRTSLLNNDAGFLRSLSGQSTSNLAEGANLYWTTARFNQALATKTTSDLAEGSNLYFTQSRFSAALGLALAQQLTFANYTTHGGLLYTTATGQLNQLTTGTTGQCLISAGPNNTPTWAGCADPAITTSDITEGTNLYWTNARFDTRLSTATLNASNITTGTLNIANGGTGATSAQQAINNISGLTSAGDLLTHNGTNAIRLARGAEGQCLLSGASTLTWGDCPKQPGVDWILRPASVHPNQWRSITYGSGLFVAVAESGANRVATSPDGVNWTPHTAAENNSWYSVTYGNGLFVAVAPDGTHQIMTSPNGRDWTPRTAPGAGSWLSVTYGNDLFVSTSATGGNVMTSLDGVTWIHHSAVIENNLWRSVVYGNGLFVAVSQSGTNRVATSSDGVNWLPHNAAEASAWLSVTYGNGLFVAISPGGGTHNVMTSPNGVDWTSRANPISGSLNNVTYGGGLFIAVGSGGLMNQVMTSPDGINWTHRVASPVIPYNWDAAVYGNGVFAVLSRNQSVVATSGSRIDPTPSHNNIYQGGMTINQGLLVNGGLTLSNFTANGGLLYTNASGQLQQLLTGTSGQCLQSNGAAAPTWGSCSTGSLTGSGTAGQLAFFDGANTLAGLSALTWDNIGNTLTITGSIVPSADITYDLGSPTRFWKDVYIGPGSLYINGQKVLQDSGSSIVVSADPGQNLSLQTSSDGDVELTTLGTGAIQLKGNVLLSDGRTIRSTNGTAIQFTDGTRSGNLTLSGNTLTTANLNGGIEIAPNGNGNTYITSGSLGIGNSDPQAKLDVTGTLRASGQTTLSNYTTNGGLLYTNASGQVSQLTAGTTGQCLTATTGNAATWAACTPANTVTGTGVAGQLTFWNGTTTQAGSANLLWDNATNRLRVGPGSGTTSTLAVGSANTTTNATEILANSLTTGQGLMVQSTSIALTTGGLIRANWSPGSATTMTGDLFSVNVGPNGTVGNLLNLTNDGLSVFRVSQNQIVANAPVAFLAAGDMSIAYDLNFTNSTSGNIKSAGPLRIQSGEPFNSSDLTLATYNNGRLVLDSTAIGTANATKLGLGLYSPTARLSLAAGTTATDGIAFGTDTNLYRSAADTLRTDDLLIVGSLQIGNGAALLALYSATQVWDPASLTQNQTDATTITITGATMGDIVTASFTEALPDGVILTAQVSTTNTIRVTLLNTTASPVDLNSGTLRVQVNKF